MTRELWKVPKAIQATTMVFSCCLRTIGKTVLLKATHTSIIGHQIQTFKEKKEWHNETISQAEEFLKSKTKQNKNLFCAWHQYLAIDQRSARSQLTKILLGCVRIPRPFVICTHRKLRMQESMLKNGKQNMLNDRKESPNYNWSTLYLIGGRVCSRMLT